MVWFHVALLVLLSAGYESLFVQHGLNPLDEGWPLYAAMQLHGGGVLYRDVFFVFPPGHLLAAWVAYLWSPPGLILARVFYAAFSVSLCVVGYFLGRRLMPPAAALTGCAMLAVAAPDSHGAHYLFGYRYFVFSALALWCFSERLRTGDRRWMGVSGALAGLQLVFRPDPATAAVLGIAAGVVAADRRWRGWLEDGVRFVLGFALVAGPVFAWFAKDVGLATLWREVLVRPVTMTGLQSLPLPPLQLPSDWDRWAIRDAFVAAQFRIHALLYGAYAVALGFQLVRAWATRRAFAAPLLLAVVVCGAVFFGRAFGRSDEAHLDSAIPIGCLLIAHAVSLPLRRRLARPGLARSPAWAALAAVFALWVFLTNCDLYVRYASLRGMHPVAALDHQTGIAPDSRYRAIDRIVREMRERASPQDVVLDLSASSLLLVLAGRSGPGGADVIMPGTFLTPAEERSFVARLERHPPALVIRPLWVFDEMPSRTLKHQAPELAAWVRERYETYLRVGEFSLMRPRRPRDARSG